MEKEWFNRVVQTLAETNETGRSAAQYLVNHRVPLRLAKINKAAGAMWSLTGQVTLNAHYYSPDSPLDTPRLLSLLVHEVRHLQQGPLVALSVYGELDAWQVDFTFQKALTGKFSSRYVEELCSLPLVMDRQVLTQARALMQQHAGKGYRIDLYPLYPLSQEILFWLRLRQ